MCDGRSVLVTCLGCWTALLTVANAKYVTENVLSPSFPILFSLLTHSSLSVRAAAGEAIALAFTIARDYYGDDFDMHMFDDVAEADEVGHLLRELSNENDRHTAKKERVEQRKLFKTYSSIFETGVFCVCLFCVCVCMCVYVCVCVFVCVCECEWCVCVCVCVCRRESQMQAES